LITERFDGNIRPEAALIIVAKRDNIQFMDLLDQLKQALLKKD
jgi:predicted RNA-binding protein